MERTSERTRDGGDARQIGQYQGKWLNKRDNHRSYLCCFAGVVVGIVCGFETCGFDAVTKTSV